jgi:hypothetical protein
MPSNRKRVAVANFAAAGFITVGAAVASAATAAAEPPPPDPAPPLPAEPAPPPPPPGPTVPVIGAPLGPAGFGVLAQNGQQANPTALGAPPITGIDQTTVLGQNSLPSPPGQDPGVIPNLNVFNNAYGVQQCLKPSAPGKCEHRTATRDKHPARACGVPARPAATTGCTCSASGARCTAARASAAWLRFSANGSENDGATSARMWPRFRGRHAVSVFRQRCGRAGS